MGAVKFDDGGIGLLVAGIGIGILGLSLGLAAGIVYLLIRPSSTDAKATVPLQTDEQATEPGQSATSPVQLGANDDRVNSRQTPNCLSISRQTHTMKPEPCFRREILGTPTGGSPTQEPAPGARPPSTTTYLSITCLLSTVLGAVFVGAVILIVAGLAFLIWFLRDFDLMIL